MNRPTSNHTTKLKQIAADIDKGRVKWLDKLAISAWEMGIVINSVSFEGNEVSMGGKTLTTPPPKTPSVIKAGFDDNKFMEIKIEPLNHTTKERKIWQS